MADLEDSIEGTTPVMDDEKMLFSISSTCQALTLASSIVTKSLRRLLLTSAKRDISLKEHCENENLEYFKYPDSLRACLVQVSNGVCDAFDAAHRSMNRISMSSEHIALNARQALELIEEGTHQEWEMALYYLQNAEESCLECVDKAAPVTKEFEKISKTINKLNEVLYKRSYEAKKEHEDTVAAGPSPWKTVILKFLYGITPLAINLAVESLKQTMMPLTQFSTPIWGLGTGEGPFTETLKNRPEKRKRETKEEYDKCTIIRKKAKEGLQESKEKASKDLKKFNQEINDLNNVKDVLQESMAQFLKVNQFWKQLMVMFQNFHDLIKDELEKKVNKTLEAGKKAMKTSENSQKIPDMTRKMIIDDSKNAIKVASMVKWISRFYVEVSNKYLLVGVKALQSITLLKTRSGYARMDEEGRKLEEDAKEAEMGIPKIAEEREKDLRNELSHHQRKTCYCN